MKLKVGSRIQYRPNGRVATVVYRGFGFCRIRFDGEEKDITVDNFELATWFRIVNIAFESG